MANFMFKLLGKFFRKLGFIGSSQAKFQVIPPLNIDLSKFDNKLRYFLDWFIEEANTPKYKKLKEGIIGIAEAKDRRVVSDKNEDKIIIVYYWNHLINVEEIQKNLEVLGIKTKKIKW